MQYSQQLKTAPSELSAAFTSYILSSNSDGFRAGTLLSLKSRMFLVTGVYPVNITWKNGARYPQIGERIDAEVVIDYDKTEFEGIDDNGALANAYKKGCEFYYFNEAR